MRRRLVLLLVVALACGVAGLVLVRRNHSHGHSSFDSDGRKGRPKAAARGRTAAGRAAESGVPAILLQPGVPARPIAGRVLSHGSPVEGATVVLTSQATRLGALSPSRTMTDSEGRFDFGDRPAMPYELSASAEGHAAAVEHVDLRDPTLRPPSDQLVLRLGDCSATISGVVRDASGGVIQGALVGPSRGASAISDAGGLYELCARVGSNRLEVAAAGYGGVSLLVDVHGRVRRDVVLVPEATFVGTVVRADDGSPVARALVRTWPAQWGKERPASGSCSTDSQGRFSITGLNPGRYWASARTVGLASAAQVEVLLEAGKSAERTLTLESRVTVRGRVVENGEPASGVTIGLTSRAPVRYSTLAVSQQDGAFVIEDAIAGESVVIARPYEVIAPDKLVVPAAGLDDLVLEVRSMAGVHGLVLFGGKPVADASVMTTRGERTVSDADGHYELLGLAAGDHMLFAQSEERGAFVEGVKVSLEHGEQRELDLELPYAAQISGVVVDQDGTPVAGAGVHFDHLKTGDQGRCASDMEGKFSCGSMTGGGTYAVSVYVSADQELALPPAHGKKFPPVELEDGKSQVTGVRLAVLRNTKVIAGRVVGAGGEGVMDARVDVEAMKAGVEPHFYSWTPLPTSVTDQTGAFLIRGLPAGTYAVRARHASGSEAIVRDVAAGARDVVLRVDSPGRIEGTLVGYSNTPPVYLQRVPRTGGFSPATVEGDHFRIDGLAPGSYVVTAQTLVEGDAALVEVEAGKVTTLTLTSGGSGVLEGTVTEWKSGAPVAGAFCHTVLRAGTRAGITNWSEETAPKTDAQGRFQLDPGPAGDVKVLCRGTSASIGVANATVPKGGVATVSMRVVALSSDTGAGSIGASFDWDAAVPRVSDIAPGSPAAAAGLAVGDVITKFNGASLEGIGGSGMWALIATQAIGSKVDLTVQRGADTATLSIPVVSASEQG